MRAESRKCLRIMKKILIMLSLIISLVSCDSGGGSSYTPSSTYSQPKTKTCQQCKGYGQVLNPYTGIYQTCWTCNGNGRVLVNGSNPSFGGKGGRNSDCPRCTSCPGWEKKSTYNSECKYCTHPRKWHFSQQ